MGWLKWLDKSRGQVTEDLLHESRDRELGNPITLLAALDYYGVEVATFVVDGHIDLDSITHGDLFSYAVHGYDTDQGMLDAWDIIGEMHRMDVKSGLYEEAQP